VNTYQRRAISLDLTLATLAVTALYRVRVEVDASYAPVNHPVIAFLVVFGIWLSTLWIKGAYDHRILGTGIEEFKVVTSASFNGFLLVCLLGLALNQHPPRIDLFFGWFGSVVLVAAGRKFLQIVLHAERRAGKALSNALIIGSPHYASSLTSKFTATPEFGIRAVGHIPLHSPDSLVSQDAWLQTIDQSILEGGVSILIIEASENASAEILSKLSWHVNQHEIELLVAPTFLHQFGPRLEYSAHSELPLVYIDEPELSTSERMVKRSIDLVLASIGILLFAPFMLVIAIGVFVSNPGPIFYNQDRVGLEGSLFRFIKFRTMVVGADKMRSDVLGTPDEEMADRYKSDPRIYPFGRILRRFSLDELPQLFSVISGKMSLVGPRPLLVEELPLLGDEDHRRHLTKPGLTGLWQINGRKETTWEERMQLDLLYVHNWTLGLDIGIIIKTIKVVLTGHGSY